MKKIVLNILFLSLIILWGCDILDSDNESNMSDIELRVNNLPKIVDTLSYVGWLGYIDNTGTLVSSTKVFEINADESGNFVKRTHIAFGYLEYNNFFQITVEDKDDTDSIPDLNTTILSGRFSGNNAVLDIGSEVNRFSSAEGVYTLVTPTDGPNSNEKSGIWFVDSLSRAGGPLQGLTLPILNSGLNYQGWVEISGRFVSTGEFDDPAGPDSSSYSDSLFTGFSFPGEDFLLNAPDGLTFPVDLSGSKVFVSFGIEKGAADTTQPSIIILQGDIPANAQSGVSYDLEKVNSPLIEGSVKMYIDIVK